MKVTLKPVDRHNLDDTLRMSVDAEQNRFVAPNIVSMAQAAVMPEFIPRLAYDGDTPVGFVLYTLHDSGDDECWIHRLLVPTALQRKGYGRAIMLAALDEIHQARPDSQRVYISFIKGNEVARRLYESLGFVDDHREIEGETVYQYPISSVKGTSI